MTDNDPVITALRGRLNFRNIRPPWLDKNAPSIRLEILSDWDEMIQISRAQAFCADPGEGFPAITDQALIDHNEQTYLLWYALRHPDLCYPDSDEHTRLYERIDQLQKALNHEQIAWLINEYNKFRMDCSPFRAALAGTEETYQKLLDKMREHFGKRNQAVGRYRLWWCVKHGILPTDPRWREMTADQWALLMLVTPMHMLAEALPDMAPDDLKALVAAPVDKESQ